jgi:hypothetical protein
MKTIIYTAEAIIKKHWKYIFLIILIIYLIISIRIKDAKIYRLGVQNSISETLLDTVKIYKNKLDELTYEKQAFNVKFSELKNSYDRLDEEGKAFVNRIRILENENKKLIAATSVSQIITVDTIINIEPIKDTINNTLQFKSDPKNEFLTYDFLIGIVPPKLTIQELTMKNDIYISHKFNNDNTRVLVNVNNSNPYFTVNDINSYVIPIDKKSHFKNYVVVGGVGIGIGIGLTGALLLLLK